MFKKITMHAVLLAVGGLLAASLFSDSQTISTPQPVEPIREQKNATLLQNARTKQQSALPYVTSTTSISINKGARTSTSATPVYPERQISADVFAVGNQLYPLREYKALLTPNDPSAAQWWESQTGLPGSWDYGIGAQTKIAIIDTGFALQHEEFADKWLENSGETGTASTERISAPNCSSRGLALNKSCNGIDDDNNGYTDDFKGWDFVSDEPSVQAGEVNATGSGVSHATAVTGVAAANGNNSLGIAGVSWGAKILPLQGLGDDGSGNTLGIARAIRYAADRGVNVINLSLGSNQEDTYMRQAIQYALERGVIVVAAAGNDGCDCLAYPARYPEVVAVGASNSTGTTSSFSSYGDNLDIVAPGSGIKTPSWSQAAPTNNYAQSVAGTSFSAPYISGLLANGKAKQPDASWGQLMNSLLQAADHRAQTAAVPHSKTIGFGYVKADAFMARASVPYIQNTRYGFNLNNADTLSAPTAQQCESNQFPTAPFYEIRQGSLLFYSISELTVLLRSKNGATVTRKGFTCTGLPTDQVSYLRQIDPAREFSDTIIK